LGGGAGNGTPRTVVKPRFPCFHSFHTDYTMIYFYGPIRLVISYESLNEYKLDLRHFATMPDIFTAEEKQQKVD